MVQVCRCKSAGTDLISKMVKTGTYCTCRLVGLTPSTVIPNLGVLVGYIGQKSRFAEMVFFPYRPSSRAGKAKFTGGKAKFAEASSSRGAVRESEGPSERAGGMLYSRELLSALTLCRPHFLCSTSVERRRCYVGYADSGHQMLAASSESSWPRRALPLAQSTTAVCERKQW